MRRIKNEIELNRFHPSRKRFRQVQKARAFFKSARNIHRETYSRGMNALYLTPIKNTSALGRPPSIKMGSSVGAIIRYIIQQIPDLFIFEIQSILKDIFDEEFSLQSIRNYIISRGIRLAKGQRVVPQSNPAVRKLWAKGMSRACSSIDQLVFIDETSHGRWTGYRWKGRSPVGTPVNLRFNYSNSKSKCLLAAMDISGVFSYALSFKIPSSNTFEQFLMSCVIRHLNPFGGPRSIVIIDNAPTHNIEKIQKMISKTGAYLICLPAYSPDLNPIEMYFHSYKSYWRRNRHLKRTVSEIHQAIVEINKSRDWSKTIKHVYVPNQDNIEVRI